MTRLSNRSSDVELVESLKAGKMQALNILYDRYSSLIYSLALKMLNQPSETEDLALETKSRLVALEGQEGLEAKGNFLFTPGRWEEEVFVALDNLPPLPQGKVYRMWVLIKGGAIFFCGEFNTDINGSVFIRLDPEGEWPKGAKPDTVFVTVEDKSASTEPSAERILVGEI